MMRRAPFWDSKLSGSNKTFPWIRDETTGTKRQDWGAPETMEFAVILKHIAGWPRPFLCFDNRFSAHPL